MPSVTRSVTHSVTLPVMVQETPVQRRQNRYAVGASLLALVGSAFSLLGQTAAAETPMWVIKDADSTIYLTGTVHMLPPELKWNGAKLDKALEDATELWLEVPMDGDIQKLQMEVAPLMLQLALSPDKPLSSRLTESEKAQLAAMLDRSELPPEARMGIEFMKPWVATQMLGIAPLLSAGYDPEAGIDVTLARRATEQGDTVLGFETMEQQLHFFSDAPEDEQMEALRATIAVTQAEMDAYMATARSAFEAWAKGDTGPVTEMFTNWDDGGPLNKSIPYETLVVNRNKDWARQIDTMLKGSGTHFIAVGAGHLAGPDSVIEQLKAHDITAERY